MSIPSESSVAGQRCELAYLKLAQRMRERAVEALLSGDDNYGLYSRTATALAEAGQCLAQMVVDGVADLPAFSEGVANV